MFMHLLHASVYILYIHTLENMIDLLNLNSLQLTTYHWAYNMCITNALFVIWSLFVTFQEDDKTCKENNYKYISFMVKRGEEIFYC